MNDSPERETVLHVHPGYFSTTLLEAEYRRLKDSLGILESAGEADIPSRAVRQTRCRLVRSELRLRGREVGWSGGESTIDRGNEQSAGPVARHEIEMLRGRSPADDGRIPVPESSQRLWAHHKYSVMARDPAFYKELGPRVSGPDSDALFEEVATVSTRLLYQPPGEGRLRNALQHMWGYVSEYDDRSIDPGAAALHELAEAIRLLAVEHSVTYLLHSTALCDLDIWI